MSRAKARIALQGILDTNDQDDVIMFLEYHIEEGKLSTDQMCERLEEDFHLSHPKTRQLIQALGGSKVKAAPRVIQKPRSFPSTNESTSPPTRKIKPSRGRGRGGRGRRPMRGRGSRGRGRGSRGRGLRPTSFPSSNSSPAKPKPKEKKKPPPQEVEEEQGFPKEIEEEEVAPKEVEESGSSPSQQDQNEEEEDTSCFICAEESEYWAIANCGHSCCARCAVKYRWTFNWIGKARIKKRPICPWCRQPWKRICIGKQGLKLSDFDRSLPFDKQLKVTYQTREERAHFHKLLEMRCPICDEPKGGYQSLDGLQNHLRDKHGSFLCTMCLDNTSKFLDEHEIYSSKSALNKHKKKMHPQCSMCHSHFYNQDVLDSHMKNEHPTCPGADCSHLVFKNMNEARGHYRTAHYLCEKDGCRHLVQLFLDKKEYNQHVAEMHTQCIPVTPIMKSRKAKRRPRTVEGNTKVVRLEELGVLIQSSLPQELVIYHQLLFSANVDAQLLFKSFRECWASQVPIDTWEKYWLKFISTIDDPTEAVKYYDIYRAFCHNPAFDKDIPRWSPAGNSSSSQPAISTRRRPQSFTPGNDEEIIFGAARPKPASSRNVTQPASREVLYGSWAGRKKNAVKQIQPRTIPKPNPRGNQPVLKGVWARRSGATPQPQPFPTNGKKEKKKKKKKKKKNAFL